MNYNYLLYFSVLAQTEHYTTAARLGISQPASAVPFTIWKTRWAA